MANPFCTGAAHIFAAVGVSGTDRSPQYLGTTETIPAMDHVRAWDAVMNDISGSRDPLDYIYEGNGEALMSFVLTRWNQAVLNRIRTMPSPFTTNIPGLETANDIGALMGYEGHAYQVWIMWQFGAALANKPGYSQMEPGRMYHQTISWGPDRTEGGTRAKKEHVIFRAFRKVVAGVNPTVFTLYSTNPTDFAALPVLIN
jgi:hypothetical protein